MLILVAVARAQEPPPIAGGTPTDDYPQAVLVELSVPGGITYCSGTLVAPE